MKKVCSILLLLSFGLGYVGAQAPQAFKYQAVIRNGNGEVITSKIVGLRISIIKDNIFGVNAYIETHTVQTNQFGLVTLNIGQGTPVLNTFSGIDWSTGSYFIKIEIDPNGGTNYTTAGDPVQLVSVPYALFAEKSNTKAKFEVVDRDGLPSDSALFEVKNAQGQTVFAVYDNGAVVYVNDDNSKGGRGGFAVGGRHKTKGTIEDILLVTPDSVRIYINDTAIHKGGRGGFAVGGRKPDKGLNNDYFQVIMIISR